MWRDNITTRWGKWGDVSTRQAGTRQCNDKGTGWDKGLGKAMRHHGTDKETRKQTMRRCDGTGDGRRDKTTERGRDDGQGKREKKDRAVVRQGRWEEGLGQERRKETRKMRRDSDNTRNETFPKAPLPMVTAFRLT